MDADRKNNGGNGSQGAGNHPGVPHGPTQPDYGAPAGWHAPGWPPQDQQPNYWYPPPQGPQQPYWPQPAGHYPGHPGQQGQAQPPYPPYPPYPPPSLPDPDGGKSPEQDDVSRSNPPAHG